MSKKISAVVPPSTVRWFPPGESCLDTQPTDVILVKHLTGSFFSVLPGMGIRFGEWLRSSTRPGAWCDHAMGVMQGGANAVVIQETAKGSILTNLSAFKEDLYCVISVDADPVLRAETLKFWNWTLGSGYGWLSIPADGLDDLTGLHLSVGTYGRMVCSSQVSRGLERMGLIPDRDSTAVQPANLAIYFHAINPPKY